MCSRSTHILLGPRDNWCGTSKVHGDPAWLSPRRHGAVSIQGNGVEPVVCYANSVALETGETGLLLTLIYTHETQGFHRQESLWDPGSGVFPEKGGDGNWHHLFHPSPYVQVAGKLTNSITRCKETVFHQDRSSWHDTFGEHEGLVLDKEFRLFSEPRDMFWSTPRIRHNWDLVPNFGGGENPAFLKQIVPRVNKARYLFR